MSTEPTPTGAGPRWLDDDEMAAWLELVQVVTLLPQALDRQLRDDAGIGHVYYQILAMLSAAPEDTLRMSELARLTGVSASRLSHAVSSLESRGWAARAACAEDGRGQVARLTDDGRAMLERTAPGHVAEVRRLVFDRLAPEQVAQLRLLATAIGEALGG
jgi:DNA-binding MarR family transcriptional regulator